MNENNYSTYSKNLNLESDVEISIETLRHRQSNLKRWKWKWKWKWNNNNKQIPVIGKGIWLDIQDRLPYYWSDWTDSVDYRVIPSVIETYFNNLLPAIAFAQDMFDRTDNSYGVNEVLLSSALAGIVFGILSGQPLCIVGVTGPISIFNYTVYEIIKPLNTNYFGFMFWIYIWSMILHLILAFGNSVMLFQYVTTFPCDIFGLFINVIYIQKGIQILLRQFHLKINENETITDVSAGFASITVALIMTVFGASFKMFTRTPLLTHKLRTLISDYSTALSVLFWSAFINFGGFLKDIHFQKLPITKAFYPTSGTFRDRSTWLAYEAISTRDVFLALPFGIIVTILFYFDHNVSSLMAQSYQYKLKKPSTFHYDFALLGITTGIAGVLGIPAPNGLIPQAPLHTQSLLVYNSKGDVIRCVEQRFTNTVQGLMILATMARPFLICLGQIPQAVLSGLFFMMGIQGLLGNTIIQKIIWVFSDPDRKDQTSPLINVTTKSIIIFLIFSLAGFTGEFAITNTIAAIGFPLILLLSVIASFIMPYFIPKHDLDILQENVAERFTIKNLLLTNLCPNHESNEEDIEITTYETYPNHSENRCYNNVYETGSRSNLN
ncbi:hypothetical protein TBLA_0A05360 [Henningerozyma blattae CBS 6284]|uniref:Bicarbonate transporter-like transmembrane domain-containing protein n=1 Tax=Henningerozyma blattae (strain ATCC 34711 / CBS 6284 / DSM 70876 / NBRC 10599 / NRRL Y-10934 / UCD 77-7) TaxID=1071380 RepID=I2GW27_HENB6|nr:hypothetical protein TBLA_0A05360 [Tetrapisispora blattae CBS 6284]CCH58329.1 hypothetical protein TBLA_0A05360 [Tetrapisispora blattae CBS 6284]